MPKQIKNKRPLHLSYSSISHFFYSKCPASWAFYQKYSLRTKNEWAARGIEVHRLLEGTLKPDAASAAAASMADRLRGSISLLQVEVTEQEITKEFSLPELPSVVIKARIDAIGTIGSTRTPALFDWKTSGGSWKPISLDGLTDKNTGATFDLTPQAMGLQGELYLANPEKKWPKALYYLVTSFRGAPQVFKYTSTKERRRHLVAAIQMVHEASFHLDSLPKIYGKACLECEFRAVCHKLPGWEALYEKR